MNTLLLCVKRVFVSASVLSRAFRPMILIRSNYVTFNYKSCCSSALKYTIPKLKFSGFRSKQKDLLLAGILTWLGLSKEEEDPLISIMKKGVLCLQREEYDKAENILHLALKLAQERQDMQAQRYIFDLLANVAFEKGDYPKAEKLFIQVTKELISTGMPSDHNAVVEISLKLASIYSQTNQRDKAEHGFRFCINTQSKKLKEINLNETELLTDDDKDTALLWAMSVDWYARHLLASGMLKDAKENFEKALDISERINGITHPQTLVLLNDIGSVQSLLKEYDSAIDTFQKAITRSKGSDSTDIPSFYCNLGATYLQTGNIIKSEEACKTALKLARKIKNAVALEDAEGCLIEIEQHKVL